jgi:uncharacterized OsmC-like protein
VIRKAATAVLEEGLRFGVDGSATSLSTDMAKSVGGGASGPTPAWLMRGALAACDATLVAMEAAREGIELTDLEVSVHSESDFRGVLGVDPAAQPGPLSMHVDIRVAVANATDEQMRAIVERVEARSPVRDALARATDEPRDRDRLSAYGPGVKRGASAAPQAACARHPTA